MARLNFRSLFSQGGKLLGSTVDSPHSIGIDSLPNIRKTLGYDFLPQQSVDNLNKTFADQVDGIYHFERLQRIEEGLSKVEPDDLIDVNQLDSFVKTGRKDFIGRLSKLADENTKFRSLKARIDSYQKNLYNRDKVKQGLRSFFDDDLRAIETNVSEASKALENQIVSPLRDKYKSEAISFGKMVSRNTDKLNEYYGVSQEEIIGSLLDVADGQTGRPIIDDFIDTTKKAYESLNKSFRAQGVPINEIKTKNYIPFTMPADILDYTKPETLLDLFKKHTNLSDESIEAVILNYSSLKTRTDFLKLNPSRRDYKFKSGADALSFFKEVNGWSNETNLFGEYFNAIRNDIQQNAIYSAYGSDPMAIIRRAFKTTKENKTQVNEAITNYSGKLLQYNRSLFRHDTHTRRLGKLFSDAVGIGTGAPASGVKRNNFIDFEGHAVPVGNGIYNQKYALGQAVQGVFRNLSYMAQHAFKGKDFRRAVDDVLSISGYANQFDLLTFSSLGLFENITESSSVVYQKSKGFWDKFQVGVSDVTNHLYKISGNNTLIDSRRARALTSLQQLWSTHFNNFANYDDWFKSISKDNPQIARQMFGTWGLGKREWEFLKQAQRTSLGFKTTKAIEKQLGIKNPPNFLTRESITNTGDEVASTFKGQAETSKQFKERVAYLWQRMIYNSIQNYTPAPNYTDSVTRRLIPETPILHVVLRGALKFIDPANAQFVNLRNSIARRVYGDTSKYIGWDRSLLYWTQAALIGYLPFTVAKLWFDDLLNNRSPRDFREKENILPLLSASGFGGYTNTLMTQMLNVYGETGTGLITGTPLGGTQDKLSKIIKSASDTRNPRQKYDTARAISRLSGYTNLWGAKGLVDYTLRKALLTPAQNSAYVNQLEHKYGQKILLK